MRFWLSALALTGCLSPRRPAPPPVYMVPSTGQSNSIGGGQQPPLTRVSAFHNWKVNPTNDAVVLGGEPTTGCEDRGPTETHATAMADTITELTGRTVVVSNSGEGSSPYSWIKKGGGGCAYAHSLGAVRAALKMFPALVVPGVVLIHGDSDAVAGTRDYDADLLELQRDYDRDIRALTGQETPVRLYVTLFGSAGTPTNDAEIKAAARRAVAADPAVVSAGTLAGAPLIPGTPHLTNAGYRSVGEMIGRVVAADVK